MAALLSGLLRQGNRKVAVRMMKSRQCTVMWFLVLVAGVFASPAHAGNLRFVTGDAFPPFADREMDHGGVVTDIVRKVFERDGHDSVEIIWRSWLKGFEMTIDGEVDGTFPYAYTRARSKSVLFSDPITNLTAYGWYAVKRGSFDANSDLIGKNLCLPLGHAELGFTGKLFANGRAKRVSPPDMKTCFKLLAAGRVDCVISPRPEALSSIQAAELSTDDFAHIEEGLSNVPLHFIVGKTHPDAETIISLFNAGLKQLRQNGELDAILDAVEY